MADKTDKKAQETRPRKSFPITQPFFDENEVENVRACLDSRWVTQGPRTKEFETIFSKRHGVKHALAVTSCTAGLHLCMSALGLGPGDEVVVPAFTWVTSANCAEFVGAGVRFADIDLQTFNLDPKAFQDAITPRTRAVVAVHLFGLSANMDEILDIAKRHSLLVIEDAACAIGATYRGRPLGGWGDAGVFSFHPRKIITTGEGGMVTTNRDDLAEKVAGLRNHGAAVNPGAVNAAPKPYDLGHYNQLGFNFRLSDILAAVGIAQMAKLDKLLEERRRIARRYTRLLDNPADIAVPSAPAECGHTYQSYVVRVLEGGGRRRNKIMEELAAKGIQTRPGTHAVHRLGYYAGKYGLRPEDFPNACLGEDTTITLPIFPGMTEADQDFVTRELKTAAIR
ncbi:MAG: DegT/DnrJ/EryC1/StrS family aminotransferase [Thermodesulfobacteriota bacterium]|nr:DegT/DnrJ/EryC1/StrS family aminotransferase [Thermodesulfobacteriota bacterium]